jgi:hypothetical protein
VLRRLVFIVFFVFGGFLFYVPKWVIFGTKASRDRKRMVEQLNRIERSSVADIG